MGVNQTLFCNPLTWASEVSNKHCIATTGHQKEGCTSHSQHLLNDGTKVYGPANTLTTNFLKFGLVPHMAAQAVAFFGEFYTRDVQFRNKTEAWTYMKASRVPGFYKSLIKSLKLIAPSVLSSVFSEMEGREGIWFLLF